jgi:hypothetical protein
LRGCLAGLRWLCGSSDGQLAGEFAGLLASRLVNRRFCGRHGRRSGGRTSGLSVWMTPAPGGGRKRARRRAMWAARCGRLGRQAGALALSQPSLRRERLTVSAGKGAAEHAAGQAVRWPGRERTVRRMWSERGVSGACPENVQDGAVCRRARLLIQLRGRRCASVSRRWAACWPVALLVAGRDARWTFGPTAAVGLTSVGIVFGLGRLPAVAMGGLPLECLGCPPPHGCAGLGFAEPRGGSGPRHP